MVDGDLGATGQPAAPHVEVGRQPGRVIVTTRLHVMVVPHALALAQK